MKTFDTKNYSESLSYLTDLNVCVFYDGNGCCLKHNKLCNGKKDPNNPRQNKDYQTIGDKLANKIENNVQNNSN